MHGIVYMFLGAAYKWTKLSIDIIWGATMMSTWLDVGEASLYSTGALLLNDFLRFLQRTKH